MTGPPIATDAVDAGHLTWLQRSHRRARADKHSWDYAVRSGIAGGVAGCVAKTAVAPLDRVKILFQTSNADFLKYQGSFQGLTESIRHIYSTGGARGLLQGHLATLLRVFPYAGIKFMLYDRVHHFLMPTKASETSALLFVAGASSGVASVFFTYPLELIRVRLAFQTKASERTGLLEIIRLIYREGSATSASRLALVPSSSPLSSSAAPLVSTSISHSLKNPPIPDVAPSRPFLHRLPLSPFYRGFTITILGMIPYAGVSFLVYGRLRSLVPPPPPPSPANPSPSPYRKSIIDLACGAVAGICSQTTSYPFEVVRRRMQVGGVRRPLDGVGWREAVRDVYKAGGIRGFYVGLWIGFLKVVPMTAVSFATWEGMKRAFDI